MLISSKQGKKKDTWEANILFYFALFISGQFYAIGFEGNVDPPTTDGEIQRVKVQMWIWAVNLHTNHTATNETSVH